MITTLIFLVTLGEVEARCPRGKRGRRCRKRRQKPPPPTKSPTPPPAPSLPYLEPPYPRRDIPVVFHVLYKDSRNETEGGWAGKVWGNVTKEQLEL